MAYLWEDAPSSDEKEGMLSQKQAEAWKSQLSSLWGKMHSVSLEAFEKGRTAARDTAARAQQAVASTASVVEAATSVLEVPTSWRQANTTTAEDSLTSSVEPETAPLPGSPCRTVSRAMSVDAWADLVVLESAGVSPTLLNIAIARSLLEYLPAGLRVPGNVVWNLRYKPKAHGISMATLFRNIADCSRSLFLVQDADEHLFGGFAPNAWETKGRFHGSGEAFVFTFGHVDFAEAELTEPQEVTVFPWTSANSYFMYADNGLLAMGGGDGRYALAVREGLLHGHSSPTPTFGNTPLSAVPGDFIVRDMELWSLDEVL